MNCDDVFDALTDPSWADAAQLDRHLANCPRCRALQNVLEPALDLLRGELPAEQGTFASPAFSPTPLLSVETVRHAEDMAQKLTRAQAAPCAGPVHRPIRRETLVAILQSAALVLFGGLVVYSVGPWNRDSGVSPARSVAPGAAPGRSCTRNDFPSNRKAGANPSTVLLACMACHQLKDREPLKEPLSSSFSRSRSRSSGPILLSEAGRCRTLENDSSRLIASSSHLSPVFLAAGNRLAADLQLGYSTHA